MVKSITNRLGQTRWSSGTDNVRRVDFDKDAENLESLVAVYRQGLLSARPAAGVPGRFYTVTGEADTKLNGRVYYDNGAVWLPSKYMADATIESGAATNVALTVKGLASQTADIFSVQSSAGTSLFRVTSSGALSNQDSVGVSAGVYAGKTNAHDATLSATSIAADKPVLVIKGGESQSAPLISARNSLSVSVFSVSNNGDATFNGVVNAQRFVSAGGSVDTISSTTAANLVALTVTPVNSNGVAAKFKSAQAPQNNLIELLDAADNRVARFTPDGTLATNARLISGTTGNETSTAYSSNFPQLYVQNNQPGAAVARLIAHSQQTANLLELVNSGGSQVVGSVTNTGDARFAGSLKTVKAVIGNTTNVTPTPVFGIEPALEVFTGTGAGTYEDSVVFRHTAIDTTATYREINLLMKLSSEANTTENAKFAGIGARSTAASAANSSLIFYSNGLENGSLNSAGGLTIKSFLNADVLRTGEASINKMHWNMTGPTNLVTMGVQGGTSMYSRAADFFWYSGGTHNSTRGNPGGGASLMRLETDESRLTVPRVTLIGGGSYNSTNPMLSLGAVDGPHMQFSAASVNVYSGLPDANNTRTGDMFIQNGGGGLQLGGGTSEVKLPSRTLYIGSNRVYFGGDSWTAVGGGPISNDWWFDHTNNQIKAYNGTAWKIVADDTI